MDIASQIERLESLIAEGEDGEPVDRDLWIERARAEFVSAYGDSEHREVKRFEAAVFPGLVKSPRTVQTGQFAQAEEKAIRRATNRLSVLVEQLKLKATEIEVADVPPGALDHLHPLIQEVSVRLYRDGHYSSAIFEGFKAIEGRVRELSRLDEPARQMMATAFNEKDPILPLNRLSTQSERDEQEGFRFIFMGASQGIRNPKAHDIIAQEDPERTLDYLALASLLMRRLDDVEEELRSGSR